MTEIEALYQREYRCDNLSLKLISISVAYLSAIGYTHFTVIL